MNKLKVRLHSLLRWSEKYFKTDMVYLAKGGFWLTFAQITGGASGFILSIAFANLLDPEKYGLYRYVLSGSSILGAATLLGMNQAISQAVANKLPISFKYLVQKRLKWGFLSVLGGASLFSYYLIQGNVFLAKGFLLVSLLIPLNEAFSAYDAVLLGKREFGRSSIYSALTKVLMSVSVIVAILLSQNILVILTAYFLPMIFIKLWISYKVGFLHTELSLKNTKSTEHYGKHLSWIGLIAVLSVNIDKILVFQFLGGAPLSVYFFSMVIPDYIKNIIKNAGILAFPKLALLSQKDAQLQVDKKIAFMSLIMIPITVIYILISPVIFKIFFPVYSPYVYLSQIYALVILLTPKVLYRSFFEAHKKSRELYIFQISSLVARIALFLIFLPKFGLIGAVVTNIVSELLIYFTLYSLNKRVDIRQTV